MTITITCDTVTICPTDPEDFANLVSVRQQWSYDCCVGKEDYSVITIYPDGTPDQDYTFTQDSDNCLSFPTSYMTDFADGMFNWAFLVADQYGNYEDNGCEFITCNNTLNCKISTTYTSLLSLCTSCNTKENILKAAKIMLLYETIRNMSDCTTFTCCEACELYNQLLELLEDCDCC